MKMMEIEKKGLATQMENVKSDREKLAEELHGQHKSERFVTILSCEWMSKWVTL